VSDSRPRVVDLFAGAGLFSYAFQVGGFRVVTAIEFDSVAATTYARNLGPHVVVSDVRSMEPEGECEVLIAGPPCQGFSTLGKRDPKDPRNLLSLEVIRWAKRLEPCVIVVENVAAFLESSTWLLLSDGLEALGYRVGAVVVDAIDFGVPQLRKRSFTFASRRKLPALLPHGQGQLTVRDAWSGLPEFPDGKNHHVAPKPSPIALSRMQVIPPGGDKRDIMRLAPSLAAPSWWRLRSEITDVWGRMEWDKPANTLRTALQNASKGRYTHPDQDRVISLREAARLQTIPDKWQFAGDRYPIARQIGNAIPPMLGEAVALSVLSVL
jgi:DNA (cytosine-5)-methyltransferase 1